MRQYWNPKIAYFPDDSSEKFPRDPQLLQHQFIDFRPFRFRPMSLTVGLLMVGNSKWIVKRIGSIEEHSKIQHPQDDLPLAEIAPSNILVSIVRPLWQSISFVFE